jgi:hypothetical protein
MDWKRVARYVRERREELGLSQADVYARGGPSTASMNLLENARQASYRPVTIRQVETALDWRHGSIARIGHGGEPLLEEELPPSPSRPSSPPPNSSQDPGEELIRRIPGLDEDEQEALIRTLHTFRRLRRSRGGGGPGEPERGNSREAAAKNQEAS